MATQTAMDPIVNRYVRYKAGTKQVVQWIASTASRQCDITAHLDCLKFDSTRPLDAAITTQLRVKTKELLDLANIIATADPFVPIPIDVLIVLEDVISLRRASATWYSTQSASQAGNDGHTFFIGVLQQIQALLSSAKGAPKRTDGVPVSGTRKQKSKKDKDSISNLFECLELEEPNDDPLGEGPIPGASPKRFKCHDFDHENEDEAFALWCYLADANDTRMFVRQMWLEYRNGDLSLSAAGTVTECAMSMLQRTHVAFAKAHPSLNSWTSLTSYLDLDVTTSKNIAYAFPSTSGDTTKLPPGIANTPDLLCASAAMQLQAYVEASENFSSSIARNRSGLWTARIGDVQCHRPITAFEKPLFAMVRELTRLSRPVLVDGTQLFYRHTEMSDGLLELTCGFADPQTREISLWLVFGTAICMDIAEIVETNATSPVDALLEFIAYVQRTINDRLKGYKKTEYMQLKTLHPQDREQWDRVLELASMLEDAVKDGLKLDDPLQYHQMSKDEKIDCHMTKRMFPSLISFPHSAGEAQHVLKTCLHDLAVYAANEQSAVLCMAHIYRAARHYGLIDVQWQDLDLVIAHHSSRRPFVTKTNAHSDEYTMLRHFLLDMGVDASKLHKSAVPGPPTEKVVQSNSKQLAPGETGFRGAFIDRHNKSKVIGNPSADLFESVLADLTEKANSTSQSRGRSANAKPRKYTPAQLLLTMKNDYVSEEPRLNFDYTTFATFCLDTLLNSLAAAIYGGSTRVPSGYKKSYELTYFLMKDVADARTNSRPIHTSAFARAAFMIERALKDGDNAKKFSTAAFSMSSGRIPKALRPHFPAQPNLEPAIARFQERFPTVKIGSLRKTIEMYDHQGSREAFEAMLDTPEMKALMIERGDSPAAGVQLSELDRRVMDALGPAWLGQFSQVLVVDDD